MRRWLTARTIDGFLRLTGEDAADRKFWTAYGDAVDEAWLLVGSAGAARLKETRLGHGPLAGFRADFRVLLLAIRGLTVARTSAEGAAHAQPPRNNLAP